MGVPELEVLDVPRRKPPRPIFAGSAQKPSPTRLREPRDRLHPRAGSRVAFQSPTANALSLREGLGWGQGCSRGLNGHAPDAGARDRSKRREHHASPIHRQVPRTLPPSGQRTRPGRSPSP